MPRAQPQLPAFATRGFGPVQASCFRPVVVDDHVRELRAPQILTHHVARSRRRDVAVDDRYLLVDQQEHLRKGIGDPSPRLTPRARGLDGRDGRGAHDFGADVHQQSLRLEGGKLQRPTANGGGVPDPEQQLDVFGRVPALPRVAVWNRELVTALPGTDGMGRDAKGRSDLANRESTARREQFAGGEKERVRVPRVLVGVQLVPSAGAGPLVWDDDQQPGPRALQLGDQRFELTPDYGGATDDHDQTPMPTRQVGRNVRESLETDGADLPADLLEECARDDRGGLVARRDHAGSVAADRSW